ncbi:MAG TPA: ABC transporter substrate-binding protein [Hyphomicrobiaceae bacterium]|nr:ABC transporter substrate-binding protein [Hyphomicrobiaceae bacterium]
MKLSIAARALSLALATGLGLTLLSPPDVRAEANTVRAAKQWGLGYLQYMLMEDMKLVEKHAKAAGLGDVKVEWNTFRSSDVMNDALISGNVDFVSLGVPGLMTIWDRTKGKLDVKGVTALNSLPLVLNVRAPEVKTLADFTEKHRIAVPAVKVSVQAILLQMAAEKLHGAGKHTALDAITITMAHPDATVAMLSAQTEVSANFSSPPFYFRQLKQPGIRRLTSSTEINGGPLPFNVVAATSKFRSENPKLYKAFLAAMAEATELINKDKRWAGEAYLRIAKDKTPIDEFMTIMNDPEINFTLAFASFDNMINFMTRTGNFKNKPASSKELMFQD